MGTHRQTPRHSSKYPDLSGLVVVASTTSVTDPSVDSPKMTSLIMLQPDPIQRCSCKKCSLLLHLPSKMQPLRTITGGNDSDQRPTVDNFTDADFMSYVLATKLKSLRIRAGCSTVSTTVSSPLRLSNINVVLFFHLHQGSRKKWFIWEKVPNL